MFTTRPTLQGTFGMVATTHWIASAAGMGVLERGGNAFDAAAAAGFVLHLAEPHMNGAGGEVPILFRRGDQPRVQVLCGQGPSPATATVERFTGLGYRLVPPTGTLAACVPGAVPAWLTLLRDHGRLPLAEVLAPAIGYARTGIPLTPQPADAIRAASGVFRAFWPGSAAVFLSRGEPPKAGALLRQPDYAHTLERLVAAGVDAGGDRARQYDGAIHAWSRGFVADAIDRFCRQEVPDATGRLATGLLTGQDLASWAPPYEAPLSADYRGWTVHKCGPWSQGPVLLQAMKILEGIDVAGLEPAGAGFVHTVTEAMKLAFADREAWYGDPEAVEVPLADLLSDTYASARRALIAETASPDLRPGAPGGRAPRLPDIPEPDGADGPGFGEPTSGFGPADGDTCHIDVVDQWGNIVSATPSGGWMQSSPVIPELGFCLGTRMQMFWLQPGLASSLYPGRRPRTTLTPSLIHAAGGGPPVIALGTPGGDQQDQWQLILLLRLLDHGMDPQAAIDAPAFHTEHFPESFHPRQPTPNRLVLERRFGQTVIDALRSRGHDVDVGPPWSEGRLSLAGIRRDGTLQAAANPRGMQGYAVGR